MTSTHRAHRFRHVEEYLLWLSQQPLLARVGTSDIAPPRVLTWEDAERLADSDEYVNCNVAASNNMVSLVRAVHDDHFHRRWNEQGEHLAQYERSFMDKHVIPRLPPGREWPELRICIANQISMHAMEILYNDIIYFDWYKNLVDILATGHVACGYEGEYPNGRLLIL